MFLPHPRVKVSIVVSLCDREVACSASDRQGSNFESCVWRTVSSQSSHHPQEVLLAQFSLYVHKGGLKPDSFHFYIALFGTSDIFTLELQFFHTRCIWVQGTAWNTKLKFMLTQVSMFMHGALQLSCLMIVNHLQCWNTIWLNLLRKPMLGIQARYQHI